MCRKRHSPRNPSILNGIEPDSAENPRQGLALGLKLFSRTTGSLSLTAEGRDLHERALRLLRQAEKIDRAAAAALADPISTLKVTAPLPLVLRLLAPALQGFLRGIRRSWSICGSATGTSTWSRRRVSAGSSAISPIPALCRASSRWTGSAPSPRPITWLSPWVPPPPGGVGATRPGQVPLSELGTVAALALPHPRAHIRGKAGPGSPSSAPWDVFSAFEECFPRSGAMSRC